MSENEDYLLLLGDFIRRQMIILGPSIALTKARKINGLTVSDDGLVTQIVGDPRLILEGLVNEYVNLSGKIAENLLASLFLKYPNIKR